MFLEFVPQIYGKKFQYSKYIGNFFRKIDFSQVFTGNDIKRKRKAEGLSAAKLAELLGVNKDNIYKWENGTMPKAKDFITIEKWLYGKLESVPRETPTQVTMPDLILLHARVSVLLGAVAELKSASSGEHEEVIRMGLEKAAKEIAKMNGG